MTRITVTLTAPLAAAGWLGTGAVGVSGQSAATYNGSPLGLAPDLLQGCGADPLQELRELSSARRSRADVVDVATTRFGRTRRRFVAAR